MRLILARHGNTFNPGDQVVWIGSRNNVPLVPAGVAQAKTLAAALRAKALCLAAVYCGPLLRTVEYGQIICRELGLPSPIVDQRLDELDYGQWSNLSDHEITARFGQMELERWTTASHWPKNAGWTGSETLVAAEVQEFSAEVSSTFGCEQNVLVISSNGKLRYFLKLVGGEFERRQQSGTFKMKTGNISALEWKDGCFRVLFWDHRPVEGLAVATLLSA